MLGDLPSPALCIQVHHHGRAAMAKFCKLASCLTSLPSSASALTSQDDIPDNVEDDVQAESVAVLLCKDVVELTGGQHA